MGIFGSNERAMQPTTKDDVETAKLEKERNALWHEEYKANLKKEVDELKRKHGEPKIPEEMTIEESMKLFWERENIPVKNIRERNGSTEA